MDILGLLGLIVTSALIDSFDPCFYALFMLVFTSAMFINYTYAIRAGLTLIIAVYIGYFLLSILLRYAIIRLPIYVLALFLLVYGSITLITGIARRNAKNSLSQEIVCRENEIPCKIASYLKIEKFVGKGLLPVFILGIISSFTIQPCSAQLLILYITITRELEFATWILLTLFYVAVFIAPIILLFIALAYVSRLKGIHMGIVRHERVFRIIGSILMISMAVYLLLLYA
ncbi:MAG: hypothetical protein QXJ69_00225 [Desulfurococcaceae archaeon]